MGILGNRARSRGNGGDLFRLSQFIVLQREGVTQGTERQDR
jgi:hypothetical protein